MRLVTVLSWPRWVLSLGAESVLRERPWPRGTCAQLERVC